MDAPSLDPYLFFDGDCREAMQFYQGVFGGELSIQTYDEMPPGEQQEVHKDMKGKVLHAALTEGDVTMMASDSPMPDKIGTGKISLSLGGGDEPKLRRYFEQLSQGGTISQPLEKAFWGDTFGMLTDKYGVDWMVNISSAESQAKAGK